MLRSAPCFLAVLGFVWAIAAGAQGAVEPNDSAFTERRVALVIGNGAYGPTIGPLNNPANDARDMAAALQAVGFEVTLKLDADRDQMRRALIDFGRSLREGGVGLFYFSGHAIQLDGSNYMIPLGAQVYDEDLIEVETVELNDVLARMGGADNRLNIVILDACRNNPFKGIFRAPMRGLAQTLAPTGTFIAYAAAPAALARDGTAGSRNSPYTEALLMAMQEPGLRLEDVFKRVRRDVLATTKGSQTPWTGSSITGDFYFRLPQPTQASPSEPPATAMTGPAPDLVFWKAIEDSRNRADFETFLEVHPGSVLAPLARRRLDDLQPPSRTAALRPQAAQPPPAEPEAEAVAPVPATPDPIIIEAEIGLRRSSIENVQAGLTALGFDTGGVDGILGPKSRRAIADWQQGKGEQPTGYLTPNQYRDLLAEAEPKLAALESARRKTEQVASVQPAVGIYQYKPGEEFRDCPECPAMIVVPAGEFMMGSPPTEPGRNKGEGPQHRVTIARPFAVGKYEVTFAEWDACWADRGCHHRPNDYGRGRGDRPVIDVSWNDAQEYLSWLARRTGQDYRLLSEAEWEYAARAGSRAAYRRDLGRDLRDANGFGLHDRAIVREWAEDCWHSSYEGAPTTGSAWTTSGNCKRRVIRGDLWFPPRFASRDDHGTLVRSLHLGFRVARSIN
jgi:formylglycine-generating enzyme required for sulfatase activity